MSSTNILGTADGTTQKGSHMASQPRKWDWIFRSLHSVTGRRQNSITINMPDTVLFTNGEPVKWLTTLADGRVARQIISGERGYKGTRHVRSKAIKQNEMLVQEQIKTIHDSFFKFRSKFSDFTPATSPLCIAWYNDGKKELLQSQTLLMLMKHREWRVQVTALQIYIKPKREGRGHYDQVHQIRLGADDISDRNAALDIVTKSLAQYAEKAYAINPNETDDDGTQSIATPPSMPTSNLKVDTMDAEFIFDEKENLWFSHLSNVMVQVVHAKRERNMEMKRLEETKLIEAASVVAKELKRLLRMANSRGVSVQSSFEHFDAQGVGYADANNLIEGLARLGIGISYPAAEILMSMIGTASSLHFRAKDLVIFAELEDETVDDGSTSTQSAYKVIVDDSMPPTPVSVKASRKRDNRSPEKSVVMDAFGSPPSSKPGTPLDLDYTVDMEAAARTNNGEPLPRWARNKTKKAYGELKRAEDRFNKFGKIEVEGYEDDISSDEDGDLDKKPVIKPATPLIFPDEVQPKGDGEESSQTSKQPSIVSLSVSVSLQSTQSSAQSIDPTGESTYDDDDINLSDKDNLFHSSSGAVMTYRVLDAANRPAASRTEEASDLQQTAAYREAQQILERLEPLKEQPFQLIVTPDVFMTLDTLEPAFAPLLDQHPLSSILLVGLPGLPNTLWPRGTVLNNECHSDCIASLLQHVKANDRFVPKPDVPLFFLGFGVGSAALLHFATGSFNDPILRPFKDSTRTFILSNSFSKVNGELKRTIQGVRRVLKKDDYRERVAMLESLMFSGEYLDEVGKEVALEEFWSTRQRVSIEDPTEAQAAKLKKLSMCSGNAKEGIVALLHGIQSGVDVTPNFDEISVPLLFLQSSKDNFIAPTNIEVFEETEEEFQVVKSPRDLIPLEPSPTSKVLNVQWLHCGHCILQERKSAVMQLVLKLVAQAHNEKPEVSMENIDKLANKVVDEEKTQNLSDFFDVLEDDMGFENTSLFQSSLGQSKNPYAQESYISNESESKDDEGSTVAEEKSEEQSTATGSTVAEKQRKKRERRAREAQVRKQREEERKMRKLADERAQELKKIRAIEQAKIDESKNLEERHTMHREDLRSSLQEEFFRECEVWEVNAEDARAKAAELQAAREEDEMAELEAEAARKRAQKHEDRRARINELRKKYLEDELTMDGDKMGTFNQGIDHLEAKDAAPYCERLLADLFQCRKRMVDAMKRAKLALDKVKVFQGEYDSIEREVRGLRRTQRLAATNSTFQAIKPTKRELEELKRKLDDKQNALSEIKSLLTGRRELLDIANRSVQGLKEVLAQKEEETKEMIKVLKIREDKMKSNLAVFRVTKDNYNNERNEIEKILQQSQQREKVVSLELKKVRRHKGKFVDTDVWQKGVMQRMLSLDIKEHLEREESTLSRVLTEFKRTLDDVRDGIYKCDKDIKRVMSDIEEIKAVEAEMTKGWAIAMAKSVAVEFEEQMKNENNAMMIDEGTEERKNKAKAALTKKGSLADEIRLKQSEDRNKEEKAWVSMDVILNPEKYSHVSEVEAEEMKFDPDYSINFGVNDIKRLLDLPPQIQLALPFLYTSLEIQAHLLLTKYSHEQGEAYFREMDATSQDDLDARDRNKKMSPEQQREAERQLNVLLKDRRSSEARSTSAAELTAEQKDWLKLDKHLNPHLYIEPVSKDRKQSVFFGGPKKNVHHIPKQGDRYEAVRKEWEESGWEDDEEDWKNPFDDISLREIYKEEMDDLDTDDERYAKFLMDKYHCEVHETVFGETKEKALVGMKQVGQDLKDGKDFLNPHGRNGEGEGGGKMGGLLGLLKKGGGGGGGEGGGDGGGGGGGGGGDGPSAEDEKKKKEEEEKAKKQAEEEEEEDNSHKVFGSWFVVHPAAVGKKSQTENFNPVEYDDHYHHPAAFQYYRLPEEITKEETAKVDTLAVVTAHPTHAKWLKTSTDDQVKVVKSMDEMGKIDYGMVRKGLKVLVTSGKTTELINEQNCSLESRQSRTHKVDIKFDGKDKILDLTVSVVFQGVFGPRGYRLGRLAVQLYRMPSAEDKKKDPLAAPQALGYAPYELQILNTPDTLGRVVIVHKPNKIPVEDGTFQVVIGAAAASKYSIQVSGTLGEDAETVLNREFTTSLEKQKRLSQVSLELNELWTSMRLAERKIAVCQGLTEEAESESARCESDIEICNNELAEDDENMEFTEEERNDVFREIKVLEVEFAHWCKLFATRTQEKKDIKEGLEQMAEMRRERMKEKENLKVAMEKIRQIIPSATACVLGPGRATEVALALDAPLNLGKASAGSRWAALSAVKDQITSSLTPAEEVRRLYQREGMKALTLEERQWCMLDKCANPEKWEWLKIREEEEDRAREARGAKPKKRKYNAAIEQFRIDKSEVDRISETSFNKLQRKEVIVKKLLMKFHDDAEMMKRKAEQMSSGFDPHLAAEVRCKVPKTWTPVEKEWVTVDKILNPTAWIGREEAEGMHFDGNKASSELMELTEEEQNEIGKEEQDKLDKVNRLFKGKAGSGTGLAAIALQANKSKRSKANDLPLGKYKCTFSREQILKIWSAKSGDDLKSNDEERVWNLLKTYNGNYQEYVEGVKAMLERQKRLKETNGMDWQAIRNTVVGESLETDIDARCRTVLKELDKTIAFRNPFMDSAVLHVAPQRFPTTVLRLELERELDRLLREQIYERERASKFLVEDSSDSDAPGNEDESDEDEDEDTRARNAEMRRKERRLQMRANRAQEDVKEAKKRIMMDGASAAEQAQMKELEDLGFGGCLACKKNPCQWISNLDVPVVMKRKEQLADELNYIRKHPELIVLDSQIALSAQRGGSTRFKRADLIHELMWESRELERRMKLNGIDKELHDCYATRKEYMEVRVLHGYSTLLWTGNARRALEREHNKLVAMTTAHDVVDDILEWMLEGWYFGERESQQVVAGYVPSLKKDGFIKPGTETQKATAIREDQEKKKAESKGKDLEKDEEDKKEDEQGTPWEKIIPVNEAAKFRISKEKAIKEGDERDHVLNETEQTMKFGLFCLTFMYFRAMKMVRREKVSWEGSQETIGGPDAGKKRHITAERKKMLEEERSEKERTRNMEKSMIKAKEGEQRKRLRQEKERAEAAKKLYDKMRQEKMEKASAVVLARVYRGHLGRKAARRWARKKAELEAMNALMNASAITIQRVHRGHKGRVAASDVRMEMAEFIAQIREEEAKQDEEEYWKAHTFARYKRDVKAFVRTLAESVRSIQVGTGGGDPEDHDFGAT
ncbi:hypothetical protein TrST_g7101 [Triparma strigata]|uniref:CRAL-TRIO domain-containing protein n=1 Tax=Triparma strigata TaxID=1606541 RepID=A0A9W7EAJ2_9STRA|nr:hypothetical protein TrST_g7101 [Triparma strigata]